MKLVIERDVRGRKLCIEVRRWRFMVRRSHVCWHVNHGDGHGTLGLRWVFITWIHKWPEYRDDHGVTRTRRPS